MKPRIRNASLHAATVVGTLGATLAIGGGALALESIPASAATPAHTMTLTDCSGDQVAHPASLMLACGDGTSELHSLRWSDWGANRATARGIDEINLCTPDCADGRHVELPVRATAERVRTVHGGRRYTRLVVRILGRRPTGVPATQTWPLTAYRVAG